MGLAAASPTKVVSAQIPSCAATVPTRPATLRSDWSHRTSFLRRPASCARFPCSDFHPVSSIQPCDGQQSVRSIRMSMLCPGPFHQPSVQLLSRPALTPGPNTDFTLLTNRLTTPRERSPATLQGHSTSPICTEAFQTPSATPCDNAQTGQLAAHSTPLRSHNA